MRSWLFPSTVLGFVIVVLAFLYINPQLFIHPQILSPLAGDNPTPAPTPIITSDTSNVLTTPVLNRLPNSPTPEIEIITPNSLTLSAQKISSSSAHLVWTIDRPTESGFIILNSTSSSPTYPPRPEDQAHFTSESNLREYSLENLTGRVFFRICTIIQNACDTYSNQIQLDY